MNELCTELVQSIVFFLFILLSLFVVKYSTPKQSIVLYAMQEIYNFRILLFMNICARIGEPGESGSLGPRGLE